MSLDVYLKTKESRPSTGSGIFVRDGGRTKEISREEWDRLHPGYEPVICYDGEETHNVYEANITHNLGEMAREAGIYLHLWHPNELGVVKADQLVDPLREGLALLRSEPERFKAYNPPNGWGSYEQLVEFVADYLRACEENPEATVRVSR